MVHIPMSKSSYWCKIDKKFKPIQNCQDPYIVIFCSSMWTLIEGIATYWLKCMCGNIFSLPRYDKSVFTFKMTDD